MHGYICYKWVYISSWQRDVGTLSEIFGRLTVAIFLRPVFTVNIALVAGHVIGKAGLPLCIKSGFIPSVIFYPKHVCRSAWDNYAMWGPHNGQVPGKRVTDTNDISEGNVPPQGKVGLNKLISGVRVHLSSEGLMRLHTAESGRLGSWMMIPQAGGHQFCRERWCELTIDISVWRVGLGGRSS